MKTLKTAPFIFKQLSDTIPVPIYRKKRIENNILIISTNDYQIEYLNEVAKDFILFVNGKRTFGEIVNYIKKEYNINYTILIADMVRLLRELQWKRIVRLRIDTSRTHHCMDE